MTVLGMASFVGSPGVSTWATLTAASLMKRAQGSSVSSVLLMEADPSGGKISTAYGFEPRLKSFISQTNEKSSWGDHVDYLPGSVQVPVLGIDRSPAAASNLLRKGAREAIASLKADRSLYTIVDFGRLYPGSPVIDALNEVDFLLLFTKRFTADLMMSSEAAQDLIDTEKVASGWAIVGKYGQKNVSIESYSKIRVHVDVPFDSKGAESLFNKPSPWKLKSSQLVKESEQFAQRLESQVSV